MSTKAQWFAKFKSWLPQWVFNETTYTNAIFGGIAKTLETSDEATKNLVDSTYIDKAVGEFLDLHAFDRNLERYQDESDLSFATRIKGSSLQSQCDKIALMALINKVLVRGKCVIINDYESEVFVNRDIYANRGHILIEPIYNTFTVIVDKQVHEPFSFSDREAFVSFDFVGQNESDLELFNSIINIINSNKAFGTLYRIVERVN